MTSSLEKYKSITTKINKKSKLISLAGGVILAVSLIPLGFAFLQNNISKNYSILIISIIAILLILGSLLLTAAVMYEVILKSNYSNKMFNSRTNYSYIISIILFIGLFGFVFWQYIVNITEGETAWLALETMLGDFVVLLISFNDNTNPFMILFKLFLWQTFNIVKNIDYPNSYIERRSFDHIIFGEFDFVIIN